MPKLLLISGSLRRESFNTKLALEAARFWDGEAELASIVMPLYNADDQNSTGIPEPAQKLADQIGAADAVVVSSPEYNQSFPGGLKNALDWVSRVETKPWTDKPVAIMSAAAGRSGGARSQYALRLALTPFMPRLITGPEVLVASARTAFDEDGRLIGDRYPATLSRLMSKLAGEVAATSSQEQH